MALIRNKQRLRQLVRARAKPTLAEREWALWRDPWAWAVVVGWLAALGLLLAR